MLLALLGLLALGGVVLLALSSGPANADTTFIVNKTGDAGDRKINGVCDASRKRGIQCTLRAAIQEANAPVNPGLDTINFNIGGTSSVKTISPATPLPDITDPVTINGYTQRGASENTLFTGNDAILKVQLNGTNAATDTNPSANGLVVLASNSTIKGLVINRFVPQDVDSNGVVIGSGATGVKVEGNFIGTNASGTQPLGNGFAGVFIVGEDNTVGGTLPAARNVISGNESHGVLISGVIASGTGNKVEGNFIGTTANGTGELGNGNSGVSIQQGASSNTIGGTAIGASNIISGNVASGVVIISGSSDNNVEGNFIGTTVDRSSPLGNGEGVFISFASGNTIGGAAASGAGNVISNNAADGVRISTSGTGNSILSNQIYQNGAVGIDLQGTNNVTDNDTGDGDSGPNNLQNFPVIGSATRDSTTHTTTITGTLNSNASQNYIIQCFKADGVASDYGEGMILLDTTTTSTGNDGNSPPFTCTSNSNVADVGDRVSMTATNTTTGDTSEFSENKSVVAGP